MNSTGHKEYQLERYELIDLDTPAPDVANNLSSLSDQQKKITPEFEELSQGLIGLSISLDPLSLDDIINVRVQLKQARENINIERPSGTIAVYSDNLFLFVEQQLIKATELLEDGDRLEAGLAIKRARINLGILGKYLSDPKFLEKSFRVNSFIGRINENISEGNTSVLFGIATIEGAYGASSALEDELTFERKSSSGIGDDESWKYGIHGDMRVPLGNRSTYEEYATGLRRRREAELAQMIKDGELEPLEVSPLKFISDFDNAGEYYEYMNTVTYEGHKEIDSRIQRSNAKKRAAAEKKLGFDPYSSSSLTIEKLMMQLMKIDPAKVKPRQVAEFATSLSAIVKQSKIPDEQKVPVQMILSSAKDLASVDGTEEVQVLALQQAADAFGELSKIPSVSSAVREIATAISNDLKEVVQTFSKARLKAGSNLSKAAGILISVPILLMCLAGLLLLNSHDELDAVSLSVVSTVALLGIIPFILRQYFNKSYYPKMTKTAGVLLKQTIEETTDEDTFLLASYIGLKNNVFSLESLEKLYNDTSLFTVETPSFIIEYLDKLRDKKIESEEDFLDYLSLKAKVEVYRTYSNNVQWQIPGIKDVVENIEKEMTIAKDRLTDREKASESQKKGVRTAEQLLKTGMLENDDHDDLTTLLSKIPGDNSVNQQVRWEARRVLNEVEVSSSLNEELYGGIDLKGAMDGVDVQESSSAIVLTPQQQANITGLTFKFVDEGQILPLNQIIQIPQVSI